MRCLPTILPCWARLHSNRRGATITELFNSSPHPPPPTTTAQLLSELGSLASVYHKPAASFVSKLRLAVQRADDLAARAAAARASGSGEGA